MLTPALHDLEWNPSTIHLDGKARARNRRSPRAMPVRVLPASDPKYLVLGSENEESVRAHAPRGTRRLV